jgi:prepilin-type N-terminal cleavage/methylation domain-containing protein/prepilin-type processing-associated H-X9-DG protein
LAFYLHFKQFCLGVSMKSLSKNTRKGAFTLIELLVVIAIFPVFAQAREKARQATCVSNLKQLSTAFLMYTQDYDEQLPPWTTNRCGQFGGNSFNFNYLYNMLVNPYIKNGLTVTSVAASGAATGDINGAWSCPTTKSQLATFSNTYAYNYYGLGGFIGGGTLVGGVCQPLPAPAGLAPFTDATYNTPATLASIAKPAEMIMLTDGAQISRPPAAYTFASSDPNNTGIWGSHSLGSGRVAPAVTTRTGPILRMITGGLTSVAYVDGHVKVTQTQNLVSYRCIMDNGSWKGKLGNATNANTNEGNPGWARDWN